MYKNLLMCLLTGRRLLIFAWFVIALSACVSNGTTTTATSKANLRNGEQAMVHTRLARGYLKQKQYAVAREELEKALRFNPNHSESNYVMALLQIELQQYDKADKFFVKAIKSNKENSAAAHDYGTFLCQTSRERASVQYFDIAVNNPLFERAELSYMRAGECLARIRDPQAERYLQKALSINPLMRPALFQLAKLKYAAKSYLSARAYIERYFAITKPQPASLMLGYQIESKLNAVQEADDYRQKLLENFSGSKEARLLRIQESIR